MLLEAPIGFVFFTFCLTLWTPYLFKILDGCITSSERSGQLGDTIGGLSAPFVGFINALLVYFAFKQQLQANELQNDAIHREQNFETLLKLYEKIEKDAQNIRYTYNRNHSITGANNILDYIFREGLKNTLLNERNKLNNDLRSKLFYIAEENHGEFLRDYNDFASIKSAFLEEKSFTRQSVKTYSTKYNAENILTEYIRMIALIEVWCLRLEQSRISKDDKIALAGGYMKPLFDNFFSLTFRLKWNVGYFVSDRTLDNGVSDNTRDEEFNFICAKERHIHKLLALYPIDLQID